VVKIVYLTIVQFLNITQSGSQQGENPLKKYVYVAYRMFYMSHAGLGCLMMPQAPYPQQVLYFTII
jgi:hypothetical protein